MNNVNTTFKNRLAIYILSVTNRHYFSINVMYPKLGCAIFNLFTKHFFWNNDSPKPPNYFKKLAQINSYPLNKSGETISKITKARGRPQFEIHIYIYISFKCWRRHFAKGLWSKGATWTSRCLPCLLSYNGE